MQEIGRVHSSERGAAQTRKQRAENAGVHLAFCLLCPSYAFI